MRYLFSDWKKLKNTLYCKFLLLLLDYDGTLTTIRESAYLAVLSKENKALLSRVQEKPDCRLAIISGRSLKDIKNIIGIKGIIYAGNHGLEIEGPKIKFNSKLSQGLKSAIRRIYKDLSKRLSGINGIVIEDKGLTISVHYRLMDEKDTQEFLNIFTDATSPYVSCDKIKVGYGKKVYEIKPHLLWDKGRAVLWLLERQKSLLGINNIFPIYIGDDATDEDAFKALKGKGLTIYVGDLRSSNADYYLKNTEEVARFLSLIAEGCYDRTNKGKRTI